MIIYNKIRCLQADTNISHGKLFKHFYEQSSKCDNARKVLHPVNKFNHPIFAQKQFSLIFKIGECIVVGTQITDFCICLNTININQISERIYNAIKILH